MKGRRGRFLRLKQIAEDIIQPNNQVIKQTALEFRHDGVFSTSDICASIQSGCSV